MTRKGHFTGQRLPAPWRPREAAGCVSLWAPTCTGGRGVWDPTGRGQTILLLCMRDLSGVTSTSRALTEPSAWAYAPGVTHNFL